MNKALVYSKSNKMRISPKKVAPVLDLIRGRMLKDAKIILSFDTTKAAALALETLKSAEANARHNLGLSAASLYVAETYVNGGRVFKSGQFVSRGHFNPIIKRTSHIVIGLSERSTSK